MEREPLRIYRRDVIDSTQNEAKARVLKGETGFLVVANVQTGGRGRMGRSFDSKRGGLYFTVALEHSFAGDATLLTPAAAVAAAGEIEERLGISCDIKWVNDLYYGGKKVAGILSERIVVPGADRAVLLCGIGINLSGKDLPEELSEIAGGFGLEVDDEEKAELAIAICESLRDILGRLPDREFLKDYDKRLLAKNQEVEFTDGSRGILRGIDADAGLIIEWEGSSRVVRSGELRLIRWR